MAQIIQKHSGKQSVRIREAAKRCRQLHTGDRVVWCPLDSSTTERGFVGRVVLPNSSGVRVWWDDGIGENYTKRDLESVWLINKCDNCPHRLRRVMGLKCPPEVPEEVKDVRN